MKAIPCSAGIAQQQSMKCWWCVNENEQMFTMKQLCKQNAKTIGHFCSFECCYAFMIQWNFGSSQISSLFQHWREVTRYDGTVLHRAPAPWILKEPYGGSMSIEDYRNSYHAFCNMPPSEGLFSYQQHVDIMMHGYRDRKQFVDMIMDPDDNSSSPL